MNAASTPTNLKLLLQGRNFIALDNRYEININWSQLRSEAEKLTPHYVNHSYGDLKNWRALCLHGLSTEKTNDARQYGYSGGDISLEARAQMNWTEAAGLAPGIVSFVRSLPFEEFFRVRLFAMEPGGYVGWHGDEGWGEDEGPVDHYTLLVAVHAPKGSAVVFGDGSYFPYESNRSLLVNFNQWHCATNPTEEVRYMLKIHGKMGTSFFDWIHQSIGESPKKESIVWGLWGSDLGDIWLNEKCRQLTSASVPQQRVAFGQSPDLLLEDLSEKCDYLVLVKFGTFVDSWSKIEREITQKQPDFWGHILNYPGEYPFLHDQFMVINLQKWRALGRPKLEEYSGSKQVDLKSFKASKENFHDDYTPHFIEPSDGLVNARPRLGSKFLSKLLEAGNVISNVPTSVRSNKIYLYPHHGSRTALIKRWKNGEEGEELHDNHRRFFDIYFKKGREKDYFWPYNSESMMEIFDRLSNGDKGRYDIFVGPASGLKLEFAAHHLGASEIKRVVIFDISERQIEFKKSLWNDWRGEKYEQFVESFRKSRGIPSSVRLVSTENQNLTILPWYNDTYLYESLLRLKSKTQEVQFVNLNAISDFEKLCDLMADSQAPLFWASNIFSFAFNHLKFDLRELVRAQDKLIDLIEMKKKGIFMGERLSDKLIKELIAYKYGENRSSRSWRDLILKHFRPTAP